MARTHSQTLPIALETGDAVCLVLILFPETHHVTEASHAT